MLGRDDYGIHADGNVIIVIFHGNLGFPIRAEIGELAVFPHLGQAARHFVRQRNRQRHQLGGLVAGIAEHHALIARAGCQLGFGVAFLAFERVVHAERDIGRLLVNGSQDGAGVAVKAVFRAVVADFADNGAHYLGDIDIAVGGNFTHDGNDTGSAGRFAGNAGIGVVFKHRVENRVGNLVADFIGMPLGYGFRGKKMFCHNFSQSFLT